jgi:ubiquinone/menaquinone biosynthesis C-methylase UbiE
VNPKGNPKSDAPDYDWNAFYKGNLIQRWWKRSIAKIVWSYVDKTLMILDVGCGSSPVLTRFPGAVGMDLNENKLLFLRGCGLDASFIKASAESIPFADNKFDYVLCLELIEHVYNPVAVFQEMNRVLIPGGKLILSTPNYGSFTWLIVEKLYGILMPDGYKLDHYNAFNQMGIIRMGEYNGFVLEKIKVVGLSDLVIRFRKEAS